MMCVTVAQTIEFKSGQSWTPENNSWDQLPGKESTANGNHHEFPGHSEHELNLFSLFLCCK